MTKNVSIFKTKNLTKQQELYGLDTGTESGKKYLESGFRPQGYKSNGSQIRIRKTAKKKINILRTIFRYSVVYNAENLVKMMVYVYPGPQISDPTRTKDVGGDLRLAHYLYSTK